jgi:PCFT/HCP family folate transporter-like MFS transporter 1/3
MTLESNMSTEATPLLVERDDGSTPPSRYWFQVQRPQTIVLLLSLIILVLATASNLMIVPTTRILEDIICHHHYEVQGQGDVIDEKLCKIDAVQSQLAYVNGLISMMEAIVGKFPSNN